MRALVLTCVSSQRMSEGLGDEQTDLPDALFVDGSEYDDREKICSSYR